MMNTDDFTAYARLTDELIDKASKEQLADVARLLALNIGYYHEKYVDVLNLPRTSWAILPAPCSI